MIEVKVDLSGPIIDGRSQAILDLAIADIEKVVGQTGYNMVRAELDVVLRNPTGYYESQVRTDHEAGGLRIHDGKMIYGPWLEGTGSRNRTTRFKGYFTFRRVTQRLDQMAGPMADNIMSKYVGKM